jgi:uncharacterized membrane protein YeaQ/YmgE (transglycosylase-associated protein family)
MEDGQALMIWLIVGATAGWLAGMPVKGGGNGLIGDITAPLPTAWITTIVGIIGSLIAGWMLPQIGITTVAALLLRSSMPSSARSSC